MVRWEYCRIMVRARSGEQQVRGEVQVRAVGSAPGGLHAEPVGLLHRCGVDEPPLRVLVLDDTIARLGHDGWELVSHLHIQETTPAHCLYFKRQCMGDPALDTHD